VRSAALNKNFGSISAQSAVKTLAPMFPETLTPSAFQETSALNKRCRETLSQRAFHGIVEKIVKHPVSQWAWKKSKPQKLFCPERSRRAEQLLGLQA
jgi:hypothetical protein